MMTSKRHDWEAALQVYGMMARKEHTTESGRQAVRDLKAGMNKSRSSYDWSHLDALATY